MKRLVVSVAVLFAASLIQAQTQPATKTTDATPVATQPVDPKAAPAKTDAATKTPAKKVEKKKEVEPIIPGVTLRRANGTFLGLEIVDTKFKLSFYDKKKKPMPVDVSRATARWPNTRSATTGDYRTVLNLSGPTVLVGARPVLPPYAWNVYITLLRGDGESATVVESFVVPFHG
jgi:hypothetical protein